MKNLPKDMIPTLLLDDRYRTVRYLIVALVLGIITVSMILGNISYLGTTEYEILEWCIYIVAVSGLIIGNVSFLVPHFLLKNRLASYFIWVFLLIITLLCILAYSQIYVFSAEDAIKKMGVISPYLNFVSSFASMTFLVAGSTVVMLFRYWLKSNQRIRELKTATLESELELLKQQVNPHFLFNMLNNVNVLVWKRPAEAKDILAKLEALLRYQLNDKEKEKVLLSLDIRFLNDFLNLEKIRRDKFEFTINQEGNIDEVWVPSLLFIPFVENAVKHNPDSDHESYVHITFIIKNDHLVFICENSKPTGKNIKKGVGGIGLKNIQRRLTLLYPERHTLEICDKEKTYRVTLKLKL